MTNDVYLNKEWNERWRGSERKERLSFLAKRMFSAKAKAIKKALNGIDVKTVLEAGCGLGYTLKVFHDEGYDCEGIDISPEATAVCSAKGLKASVMNLSDVSKQFDLVSSDGMLEHFLDFEPYVKLLMNISRYYVLLIQPNHGSFVGKTCVYLSELLIGKKIVHEYNYRIKDFIDIFFVNGFEIVRNEKIFFDVFRLLLFKKKNAYALDSTCLCRGAPPWAP